jgi:hypothetical protein
MKKKNIFPLILLLSSSCISSSYAESVSIEDADLIALNQKASVAIKSQRQEDADWLGDCSFIARKMKLNSEKIEYFFVTTKDACGWGAAAGPIYVVSGSDVATKVILATSGYTMEVDSAHVNHGLPNLTVTSETSGTNAVETFEYNSKEYTEKVK